MDTDGNKQITFEEFLSLLKQEKDSLESQMAERFGMKIYKSADGFTQEEIYDYACLLYTSPSPRDQRGSRMPSSA